MTDARESEKTNIQEHLDYCAGFFDAMDGAPLFERECSYEYAAGWRALHEVKRIIESMEIA